jgi:hypothetical protein
MRVLGKCLVLTSLCRPAHSSWISRKLAHTTTLPFSSPFLSSALHGFVSDPSNSPASKSDTSTVESETRAAIVESDTSSNVTAKSSGDQNREGETASELEPPRNVTKQGYQVSEKYLELVDELKDKYPSRLVHLSNECCDILLCGTLHVTTRYEQCSLIDTLFALRCDA